MHLTYESGRSNDQLNKHLQTNKNSVRYYWGVRQIPWTVKSWWIEVKELYRQELDLTTQWEPQLLT